MLDSFDSFIFIISQLHDLMILLPLFKAMKMEAQTG